MNKIHDGLLFLLGATEYDVQKTVPEAGHDDEVYEAGRAFGTKVHRRAGEDEPLPE
jgi:hypothetical protein